MEKRGGKKRKEKKGKKDREKEKRKISKPVIK